MHRRGEESHRGTPTTPPEWGQSRNSTSRRTPHPLPTESTEADNGPETREGPPILKEDGREGEVEAEPMEPQKAPAHPQELGGALQKPAQAQTKMEGVPVGIEEGGEELEDPLRLLVQRARAEAPELPGGPLSPPRY